MTATSTTEISEADCTADPSEFTPCPDWCAAATAHADGYPEHQRMVVDPEHFCVLITEYGSADASIMLNDNIRFLTVDQAEARVKALSEAVRLVRGETAAAGR
jgi:hypothetical protein